VNAEESHNRLTVAFTNLGNTLASNVEPHLTPVLDDLTKWASGPDASKRMDDLGKSLSGINWKQIGSDVGNVGEKIDYAVKHTTGWEHAIEALGAQAVIQALGLGRLEAVLVRLVGIQLPAWLLGLITSNPMVAGAALLGAAGYAANQAGGNAYTAGQMGLGSGFRDNAALDRYMHDHPAGGGSNATRGFRNNNPLNLHYVPGQIGSLGADETGVGIYPSMEAGIAQEVRQLKSYAAQGDNTIRKIVSRWAPSSDGNDVEGYVANVSRWTGIDQNRVLDLNDRTTLAMLVNAMSKQENSASPNSLDLLRGIEDAFQAPGAAVPPGAPPVPAAQTNGAASPTLPVLPVPPAPPPDQPTLDQKLRELRSQIAAAQNGHVQVDLNVRAPAGTTAETQASGIATMAPPRIDRALPDAGMTP
jgi:hypothetical protein